MSATDDLSQASKAEREAMKRELENYLRDSPLIRECTEREDALVDRGDDPRWQWALASGIRELLGEIVDGTDFRFETFEDLKRICSRIERDPTVDKSDPLYTLGILCSFISAMELLKRCDREDKKDELPNISLRPPTTVQPNAAAVAGAVQNREPTEVPDYRNDEDAVVVGDRPEDSIEHRTSSEGSSVILHPPAQIDGDSNSPMNGSSTGMTSKRKASKESDAMDGEGQK